MKLTDGSLDFNEALKDNNIQKTFLDFVKVAVKPKGNGNSYYEMFSQAYNSLNFLGIDKDKITRKNTYTNLFNDGLHGYYASYFDYLIKNDSSLFAKSKALYNLFGVTTKVMYVNEFNEIMSQIGSDTEKDLIELFGRSTSPYRSEIGLQ